MPITASEARKGLFPLIKQVNDDHDAIEIVSKHGEEHRLVYVVTEAEIIILAARYRY